MPSMRWETHERGWPHRLGIAGNSGCQREKLGGALNPRHHPYTKFWNYPRDELMRLGPFSQRGQKFQTDSKPVVFHALTINDACLGTEARLRRAKQHGVPWEPDVFRCYLHPASAHVLGNSRLFEPRIIWTSKLDRHFFRDSSVGSASWHGQTVTPDGVPRQSSKYLTRRTEIYRILLDPRVSGRIVALPDANLS